MNFLKNLYVKIRNFFAVTTTRALLACDKVIHAINAKEQADKALSFGDQCKRLLARIGFGATVVLAYVTIGFIGYAVGFAMGFVLTALLGIVGAVLAVIIAPLTMAYFGADVAEVTAKLYFVSQKLDTQAQEDLFTNYAVA